MDLIITCEDMNLTTISLATNISNNSNNLEEFSYFVSCQSSTPFTVKNGDHR